MMPDFLYAPDRCAVCQGKHPDVIVWNAPHGDTAVAAACEPCAARLDELRGFDGKLTRRRVEAEGRLRAAAHHMPALPPVPDPCRDCGSSVSRYSFSWEPDRCGVCSDSASQACGW